MRNRSSVVGTPSRLRARRYGIQVLAGAGDFSLFRNVQTGSGAHTVIRFNGYRGYIAGVKRSGSEDNLLPPSSAEVKKEWSYTPGPLYTFTAWKGKLHLLMLVFRPTG